MKTAIKNHRAGSDSKRGSPFCGAGAEARKIVWQLVPDYRRCNVTLGAHQDAGRNHLADGDGVVAGLVASPLRETDAAFSGQIDGWSPSPTMPPLRGASPWRVLRFEQECLMRAGLAADG